MNWWTVLKTFLRGSNRAATPVERYPVKQYPSFRSHRTPPSFTPSMTELERAMLYPPPVVDEAKVKSPPKKTYETFYQRRMATNGDTMMEALAFCWTRDICPNCSHASYQTAKFVKVCGPCSLALINDVDNFRLEKQDVKKAMSPEPKSKKLDRWGNIRN